MTTLMNLKKASLLAAGLALCFLAIHIFFFLLFLHTGVKPMMYFNIFSIAFYIFVLLLIKKGFYKAFAISVYLEVVVHMFLATIFTGWEPGFQNTLIGISFLVYYAEYVGRYLRMSYVKATPLCLLGMSSYLCSCIICHFYPAPYPLPDNICFMMQITLGIIVFVVSIFFLFTFVMLASKSEEMLSNEVGLDKLTGLPNRYRISDYLDAKNKEDALDGMWIAMLDIDYFKQINDTLGHNCGDAVLVELSTLLQSLEGDAKDVRVGRWGGEEFLLLGRVVHDMDQCIADLNLLRENIMNHRFCYQDQELNVTVTIGVAKYSSGDSIHDWIDAADRKMYTGKQNGRNQVVS